MTRENGLLFDLDGVITDTAEYHFQAWKKLADSLQIPFDKEDNEALKGLSRSDSLERLLGERRDSLSKRKKEELTSKKNADYIKLLEGLTKADVLPGMEEILKELRKRNIPVGLASASKNAPFVLKKLELDSYFQIIVNPSDLKNGKPAPDIYLKGAELLGIPPERCIGIEDAVSGVQAIKAAGMLAIGIGDYDDLTAAGAEVVLTKTNQLTWEVIDSLLMKI